MKRIGLLVFLWLATVISVLGQAATSVTATITDQYGVPYASCTWTATFLDGPLSAGQQSTFNSTGNPVTPRSYTGSCNAAGTLTQNLWDNAQISPVGSYWSFSYCASGGNPCSNVTTKVPQGNTPLVTGASVDLSALLSGVAKPLPAASGRTALPGYPYTVATLPTGQQPGTISKVIDGSTTSDCTTGSGSNLVTCQWTGSAWAVFSGGGGGSGNLSSTGLTTGTFPIATAAHALNDSLLTDPTAAQLSYSGTNGMVLTGGGGVASFLGLQQGTAQATQTNTIGFTAPTAVTAYNKVFAGAAFTGLGWWTNSAGIQTEATATAANIGGLWSGCSVGTLLMGNDGNCYSQTGGTVTSVTASSPLASSGGTTPAISLTGIVPVANGGNGTATPSITAGTGISVSGSWAGYTISTTPTFSGTPNPNYQQTFTGQTTVTLAGTSHKLGSSSLVVACYDSANPANEIQTLTKTINPSTFDVVVTFSLAQTGYCVVNGSGPAKFVSSLASNTSWTIAATTHNLGVSVLVALYNTSGYRVEPNTLIVDASGNVTITVSVADSYTAVLTN